MSCAITFSRTRPAIVAIPEYGITVGNSYWASDQELPGPDGTPVRLIGQLFLQREDEDEEGRPPRYAGNAYLAYNDCTQAADGTITCQLGACIVGTCCYETLEGLCPGEFQGPNTVCELPECYDVGACCGAIHSIDCIQTTRVSCPTEWFGAGRTCDEVPGFCRGACCTYDLNKGTFCQDDTTPSECRDFQDFLPQFVWTVWMGPETTCNGVDCPSTGGCCQPPDWKCVNLTPDECVGVLAGAGVFMGLGRFCGPGTCNGACCYSIFDQPGTPSPDPGCSDDRSLSECELLVFGHFLGPGSTCDDNAGDCGVCCLWDNVLDEIICHTDMLQTECLEQAGVPFGPGSHCAVCDTVRYGCCIAISELPPTIPTPPDSLTTCVITTCVNVRSLQDCRHLGGSFVSEGSCEATGACAWRGAACCCPDPSDPENCLCENIVNCDECLSPCRCHQYNWCQALGDVPVPPVPGAPKVCAVDCNIGNNCDPVGG